MTEIKKSASPRPSGTPKGKEKGAMEATRRKLGDLLEQSKNTEVQKISVPFRLNLKEEGNGFSAIEESAYNNGEYSNIDATMDKRRNITSVGTDIKIWFDHDNDSDSDPEFEYFEAELKTAGVPYEWKTSDLSDSLSIKAEDLNKALASGALVLRFDKRNQKITIG